MSKELYEKFKAEAGQLFEILKSSADQTQKDEAFLKADLEPIRMLIIMAMRDSEISDEQLLKLTKIFQEKLSKEKIETQEFGVPPEELTGTGKLVKASATYESEDLSSFFSLGEFVHAMCFNQQYGYYSQISENLGFATIANNEAQFGFAMSLLSKAINHWKDNGEPKKFAMVQLSGGNGELDLVILNIARIMAEKSGKDSDWGQFYEALNFRTIDISPSLSAQQQEMGKSYKEKYDVIHGDATQKETWDKVEELGCGAHFIWSNELLDMLFPEYFTIVGKNRMKLRKVLL